MSKVNMDLSHMPVNVIAISNTHQTYGVAVNTAFMVENQTYLIQRNIKNNAGLSYILVIQNGAVVYATPVDDFSINNLNNRVLVQGIVDKFVPCDDKVQNEQSKRLPDGFDPSKIRGLPYDFAFASGAAQRVLDLINSDQNKTILIDLSKGKLRTQDCTMDGGNISLGDLSNTGFESVGFPKTLNCGSRLYMVGNLAHKAVGINKGDEAVALDIAHSRTTPPLVMGICDSTPKILMRKDDDTGANSIYLDIEGDQRWIADVAGYDTDVIDEVNKLLNSEQPKSLDMGPVTEYYCAPIEEIYGTCRVMDEGEFGITTPSYWSIYSRHQSGISQWVADYADAGLCKSQTDLLNAKLTIK